MSTASQPVSTPTGKPAGDQGEELNVLTTMKALRDGEFVQELQDKMDELHEFAVEHGKSVSITVKFTLTPNGRTISVDDDISGKVPKLPKEGTIFFSDKGKFTRKDPKQIDMQDVDPAFRGRR